MRKVLRLGAAEVHFASISALLTYALFLTACVSSVGSDGKKSHSDASRSGNTQGALASNSSSDGLLEELDEGSEEDENFESAQDGNKPDIGHILDVGGDELLDETVEKEVEATSVEGTKELAKLDTPTQIPVMTNERVGWWINYYTGRGRERFQRHLDRADMHEPLVRRLLRENGVPEDLFYLALIESGFVVHAKSHAGAVGIWQFMGATGRRYGLQVNKVVDERRDVRRATKAAAAYLTDLHNLFNNWYLAFAAYNCGEYRVVKSILTGKSRDFWELSELQLLPKETRHYVPKFLAAMQIANDREKYGFQRNDVALLAEAVPLEAPSGVKLADVAKRLSVEPDVLLHLNPHLLKGRVPATGKSYQVWVPAEQAELVAQVESELVPNSDQTLAEQDAQDIRPTHHKVARGDNLNSIARKYNTTVAQIKKLNGLKSSAIRSGQRLVVARVTETDSSATDATPGASALARSQRYQAAARKLDKVTTASPSEKLRERANNGQNVAATSARGRPSQTLTEQKTASGEQANIGTHVVRKGESLASIADDYDMNPQQLKELNRLRSSKIFPGKRLKVIQPQRELAAGNSTGRSQDFVFYRVKTGDSLQKISRRFGVEPDQIKEANDFARNELFAGELIRVPSGG